MNSVGSAPWNAADTFRRLGSSLSNLNASGDAPRSAGNSRSAAVGPTGREAETQEAEWICTEAPFVDAALPRDSFPDTQTTPALAAPMVEHNIVPQAAQLLHRIARSCHSLRRQQAAGQLSERATDALKRVHDPCQFSLRSARFLCQVLSVARNAVVQPEVQDFMTHGSLRLGDEHAVRALCEQLRSSATLQALADATRWAMMEAEADVARQRQLAGAAASASSAAAVAPSYLVCCIVQTGANAAYALLRLPVASTQRPCEAPAPSITAQQRLQLLRDLHSTGLFAAVCDAAVTLGSVNAGNGSAQNVVLRVLTCCHALWAVQQVACDSDGLTGSAAGYEAAAPALLSSPEVRRLRLAALEQLAASAPPVGWSPPPLVGGGEAAMGSSAASEAAGSRSDAGATWPMLSAPALRACGRTQVHVSMAAVHVTVANAVSTLCTMRGFSDRGNLPPPARMAALTAAACRAMAAEMQAEGERQRERREQQHEAEVTCAASCGGGCAGSVDASGVVPPMGQAAAGIGRGGACRLSVSASTAAQGDAGNSVARAAAEYSARKMPGAMLALACLASRLCGAAPWGPEAEASMPGMLEALGWSLWAVAFKEASFRAAEEDTMPALEAAKALMVWTECFERAGPAAKAETLRRLLPTRLFASLGCLLRREAAKTPPSPERLCPVVTASGIALQRLLSPVVSMHISRQPRQQRPPSATSDATGGSSGGSSGTPSGRPLYLQDDLGLFITMAKLARRETAAATAVLSASSSAPALATAPSHTAILGFGSGASPGGENLQLPAGPTRVAPVVTFFFGKACYAVCQLLCTLAEGDPTPAGEAPSGASTSASTGGSSSSSRPRADGSEDDEQWVAARARWSAALREAAALTVRAGLPLLGALLSDGAPAEWRRSDALPKTCPRCSACSALGSSTMDFTHQCIWAVSWYLETSAAVLPPEEVLALAPQRLLALVTRRLQEEIKAETSGRRRRTDSGRRRVHTPGCRTGGWESIRSTVATLAFLAAHEGLVCSVAGWLRRDETSVPALAAGATGGDGGQQQQQQPEGIAEGNGERLDVGALLEAARYHRHTAAADRLRELCNAARRMAGGRRRDRGLPRELITFALDACRREGEAPVRLLPSSEDTSGGCHDGPPLWPPRELRLCCNLRCTNFTGPAEATLPLRRCAGCRTVRYCGAECQRQDWAEGGHKALCARIREEVVAAAEEEG